MKLLFTDAKTKKVLSETQRPKNRGTEQHSFIFKHYSMFDRVKSTQGCKTCGGK
jgi:hypothetical protein